MPSKVHIIDTNADTVIVLSNPLRTFAPWDEDEAEFMPSSETKMKVPARKKKTGKMVRHDAISVSQKQLQQIFGGFLAVVDNEAGADMTPKQEPNTVGSSIYEAASLEPYIDDTPDESIHYHVSSRHLIVASTFYKLAMTQDGWAESHRSEEDKLFHIQAESWDPEAFLILLNIFHLRHRKVPRAVSLEMLAKIAVIVDFYHDCGEAIELFTTMWIDQLRNVIGIPTTYGRDLVLWICIARVFGLGDDFKQATATVVIQSEETLRTLGLPIFSDTYDAIDLKRYQAMESIIGQLHDLLDKYRSSSYKCPSNSGTENSFNCASFLLGTMTKELDRMMLYSPRPEIPFAKLSLNSLCEKLRTIKSPIWHESYNGYGNSYQRGGQHSCNLNTTVVKIVDAAKATATGLELMEVSQGRFVPVAQ